MIESRRNIKKVQSIESDSIDLFPMMQNLDYIGFAIVAPELYEPLNAYARGEVTIHQLRSGLVR